MAIRLNEQFDELAMSGSTQWYNVKINVESDDWNEINRIQQVEYYLGPSASSPVVISENPNDKFAVQMTSWLNHDEFPVSAKITFKDNITPPVFLEPEQGQLQ